MTIEIRPTSADELRSASATLRIALLDAPPDDEAWAATEASWTAQHSYSAWEGAQCVAHVSYFDVDTTVPGGASLPTAAITRAGVLPTHVRRGIFTDLMTTMIDAAVERGLPLASLRASEATIYERFGFGMAAHGVGARIDPSRATPLRGAATGTVELVAPTDVLDTVRALYDRAARRPGVITRPTWLWERYFENAVRPSKEVVAVHRDADGELDGYIHYELSWNDDPLGVDTGSGHVHEVWAVDAGAELALWEYVLGIDLVRTVRVDELAPDSVLFAAAADQRAVRLVTRWDEQWLRILDVDAALTARTYGPATPVTIAVAERDGTTRGTWRVAGEGAERSDGATPDVTTDIAGLSAAYLGSTSWWELVATGRATATGPAAIVGADALFASRPLAFCGSFF